MAANQNQGNRDNWPQLSGEKGEKTDCRKGGDSKQVGDKDKGKGKNKVKGNADSKKSEKKTESLDCTSGKQMEPQRCPSTQSNSEKDTQGTVKSK